MLLNVKHQIIFGIALSIIDQSKAECEYGMYKDQWSGDCLECADCRTNGEDVKRSYETECMQLPCPRFCGHDFATDLNLLAMPKMQCTDDPVPTTLSSSTTQNGSIPTYSSMLTINMTTVAPTDVPNVPVSSSSDLVPVVISVSSLAVLIVLVLLGYCCRRNNGNNKNEEILDDGWETQNGTTQLLHQELKTTVPSPCTQLIGDLSSPDSVYQRLHTSLNNFPSSVVKIAKHLKVTDSYLLTLENSKTPFKVLYDIYEAECGEMKVSHIVDALTQGTVNTNEEKIIDNLMSCHRNCNMCRYIKNQNTACQSSETMRVTENNSILLV